LDIIGRIHGTVIPIMKVVILHKAAIETEQHMQTFDSAPFSLPFMHGNINQIAAKFTQ